MDAKAQLASPIFTGTVSGITKGFVGLGNVDNTSDLNKPISSATQTALDAKANSSNGYTKAEVDTKVGSGGSVAITLNNYTSEQDAYLNDGIGSQYLLNQNKQTFDLH